MERPRKQFELWPPEMTTEELNEKLRKAADRDREEGKDLVSKEETTKALEGEDMNTTKTLSQKESAKKAGEALKKLEEREKKNKEV